MNLDDNLTKIILAIIGVVVAAGGSFIAFRINKRRSNRVRQENITINGSGKVVGGDDNSKN